MYRNKPILFCTAKMLVSHACKCLRLLRHMNIDLSILILFMYTVNRQLRNDVFYKPQTHTHTNTQAEKPKPSRYIKRPVETPISEIAGTTTPSFSMVRRSGSLQCESMSTYYVWSGYLQNWMLCPFHLYYSNWYDMHLLYLACMSTAYNANTACFPTSVELRDPFNAILHHAMPCSASGRLLHVRCRQA